MAHIPLKLYCTATPASSSDGAPNRAQPQHLYQHITASEELLLSARLDVEGSPPPVRKYSQPHHIYGESILCRPWDSTSNARNFVDCPFFLFLSHFCPVVFPYSWCALWTALTIPPSNPFEKAPTKKTTQGDESSKSLFYSPRSAQ